MALTPSGTAEDASTVRRQVYRAETWVLGSVHSVQPERGATVDADEIASICQVKYQYFRHLDLKEFDQLGELLTEGCSGRL